MVNVPRLIIAAPASGQGKTSVTAGLLAALGSQGLAVSPHKVGPDYIDPGYHALAAGRVGRNLDPWLVGEERIVPLFLHGARTPAPADIAVIEGVMGLYDGVADQRGFSSTAHVAKLLQAPVLLVVDATAAGRSVAALVHGFASFDRELRIGGVILNRVGSDRHEQILRDGLAEIGMPVFGAIRRHDALVTPSRHLGLVPAAERSELARRTVTDLGGVVAASVDLAAVVALARRAPPLAGDAWSPTVAEPAGDRPVVAIAAGPAFTFSYAETSEMLTAAGAEVQRFDPTVDEELPYGTRGIVIGGGFPEVHAAALSANEPLRRDISQRIGQGAAVAAECAGLLYLAHTLDGAPMCDVIATDASMTPRLTIGYRDALARTSSVLAEAGTRVRGHEFHRTACAPAASTAPAWSWDAGGQEVVEGHVQRQLHASYLHLHWAGLPNAATRFVSAAARVELASSR
ncbi:cobyrinic acid a,c-diamide synthase [Jatrophihabitans sp. GAS493]|uniref:cobyrinate a,c-diamide synthase n=1 Tax=Jatrophihabitans sp. GAS493 TaxID=1907575 RepID=UPI000BB7C1B8|nr:cobyrinate a,c-diamide synthase [Jatrophihabitans sp. GAS493]SOD74489.1 cobyrinic acid a,c-diamide synthase [Jatrophihabitans sp. GAS493]